VVIRSDSLSRAAPRLVGAISERPAGARPSDRNGQRRWLLNGARGRGHYGHAVLAPPHFTSHTSQEARCTCPAWRGCATRELRNTQSACDSNSPSIPNSEGLYRRPFWNTNCSGLRSATKAKSSSRKESKEIVLWGLPASKSL